MSELIDRLRGKYVIPVNDGAGPLNGSMEFIRQFPTPPIHHEAADALEAQAKRIAELEASLADSDEALQILGLKLAQAEAENVRLRVGHERYEIVRRLNAHQFTELFRESISKNKRFDDLVDATRDQGHSSTALGGPTPVTVAAPACEQLLADYRNGIPIKVSPETRALAEKVVASKSVLEMSDQELRDWAHGMTHRSNEDTRNTGESDRTSDSQRNKHD